MKLIDTNHPIYQPLWTRLLIVAVCAGWTVVEIVGGEPMWAWIVGALAVYSAYVLLITFKPMPPETVAPVSDKPDGEGEG